MIATPTQLMRHVWGGPLAPLDLRPVLLEPEPPRWESWVIGMAFVLLVVLGAMGGC